MSRWGFVQYNRGAQHALQSDAPQKRLVPGSLSVSYTGQVML